MKAIVYNNQSQAESLMLRLKNKVQHLFKGATTEYTYTITHPINGNVAVIIEPDGIFWSEIFEELNPNDINLIEELDQTWFNNSEL